MKKVLYTFMCASLIGAAAFMFTACSMEETTTPAAEIQVANQTPETTVLPETTTQEATTQPEDIPAYVLVNHRSGQTYVPINPQRVIVFDMGALDTLQYLGLSDRVVGLPKNTVPPHLHDFLDDTFANVGTLHEPNFEELVRHEFDLIIISGRARPSFDELSQLAPVIDLGLQVGDQMATFVENTTYLGRIFQMEDQVADLLERIDNEVQAINDLANQLEMSALIVLYNSGAISAFGPSGRFALIHDYLGVPTADPAIEVINHGMAISYEYIVDTNPDILFVINRNYAMDEDTINLADFEDNELIQLTSAYGNGNIHYLNSWVWYVAPGGASGKQEQMAGVRHALENAIR